MSVELDTSFDSLVGDYPGPSCKPAYRVKWLKTKGAILILIWNYLVFSVYHLFQVGYKESWFYHPFQVSATGIIMWSMAILFPIGGWLADSRIGRYKVIHYSTLIMWIGMLLATFGELLLTNISATNTNNIKTPVYLCLCIVTGIGFCGFLSNIVNLGIDQLTDASATEITSFITWYTVTMFISGITVHFTTDCLIREDTFYCKTLVVSICLTLAVCIDFIFQQVLVKEHVDRKSLRVILQVIQFVIKHRHLKQGPSRFDIAKHMYGGPFTSQQVDNVRKFLWILVILTICATVFGTIQLLHYAQEKGEHQIGLLHETNSIRGCYTNLTLRYSSYFIIVVLVGLYEFVIHPLLYRCLPKVRITSKFLSAIAIFFLWILSLVAIEIVLYQKQTMINQTLIHCTFWEKSTMSLSSEWFLVPSFFQGLSIFLLVSSALEFLWSQAPSSMKGLILGLGFMFIGISTILQTALTAPFVIKDVASHIPWEHAPLTCAIWYYLMEAFIILSVLVTAAVVINKYNSSVQKETTEYFDPYESSE